MKNESDTRPIVYVSFSDTAKTILQKYRGDGNIEVGWDFEWIAVCCDEGVANQLKEDLYNAECNYHELIEGKIIWNSGRPKYISAVLASFLDELGKK